MYISKVQLKNVRCFDELTIDFERRGSSALISGDNGDGKTAVLRSIAMGLCDQSSAAALLRDLQGSFVKKGKEEEGATIDIELVDNKAKKYQIVTQIKSLEMFEKVEQSLYEYPKGRKKTVGDDGFPWGKVFVAGYGAGLRTQGTADYDYYVSVDALYPLFKYDLPLQNPDLGFLRLVEMARAKAGKSPEKRDQYEERALEELSSLLTDVLSLGPRDKVLLTSWGIEIKRGRNRVELKAAGDGHRSTVTWILDLISWWLLYGSAADIRNISGIVLVDEVENHLHPRWQIDICRLLKSTFPKIQFIMSTHSPLVISGSDGMRVHALHRDRHEVFDVSGWLAEDVYRDVMGLGTSRSASLTNALDELQTLHLKGLRSKSNSADRKRLKALEDMIRKRLPESDPILVTAKLKNLMKNL